MAAQGIIVTRTFTSNAMIPVPDVTVVITQLQPDGLYELISVQITNDSGETPPVTVETPDVEESLSPGNEKPFATVNIEAESPMYERILVENVQVFPHTETFQELKMVPLDEVPEDLNESELFETPPQNL